LRDELSEYSDSNVQVLGISVDSPFALKAWADQQGYKFPLLADFWPHGAVAQAYGVFNEKAGLAVRGTFLVDTTGVVRFAEANPPGEARDQTGWKKAIATIAP
jgi:peroxiredoxin